MKTKKWLALLIALLATYMVVFAQYKGPISTKLYMVNEIKENASQLDKSDALVKLKGFIVDRINEDTFWFQDSSGRIQVEIEKKQIPTFAFDEKTELIIVGEVDYDLLEEVEIEAEFIQLASQ